MQCVGVSKSEGHVWLYTGGVNLTIVLLKFEPSECDYGTHFKFILTQCSHVGHLILRTQSFLSFLEAFPLWQFTCGSLKTLFDQSGHVGDISFITNKELSITFFFFSNLLKFNHLKILISFQWKFNSFLNLIIIRKLT